MELDSPLRTGNRFRGLEEVSLNTPQKRKKKTTNITEEIFPLLPETNIVKKCPKFIIIKSTDNNNPLSNFSVFAKKKALDSISTEIESVSILRDGSLLVLAKNQKVAERFIRSKNFGGLCPVSITFHESLNSSKGTIFDRNLIPTPENEILDDLKNQGVTAVHKFTKLVGDKRVHTGLILLTFNSYQIPNSINIAWYKLGVREYYPNPMRCRNCQILGHTSNHCNNNAACVTCNLPPHQPINCTREFCANCCEPHPASSPTCPKFQQQKEILKIKTQKKCSIADARRLYKQNHSTQFIQINKAQSFSSTLKGISDKRSLPNIPQQPSENQISTVTIKNPTTISCNKNSTEQANTSTTSYCPNSPVTTSTYSFLSASSNSPQLTCNNAILNDPTNRSTSLSEHYTSSVQDMTVENNNNAKNSSQVYTSSVPSSSSNFSFTHLPTHLLPKLSQNSSSN